MARRLVTQFRSPLRTLFAHLNRPLCHVRAFHDGKANLVILNSNGLPETRKLDVFIGDPHEAYVIIDRDVGFVMRSAMVNQSGTRLAADMDKVPLTFHHNSRHFAIDSTPFPRIIIENELPRQDASNTSPATLWLWGATHSITLDGTPDHDFEESCRESHGRLEGVAELLKDR